MPRKKMTSQTRRPYRKTPKENDKFIYVVSTIGGQPAEEVPGEAITIDADEEGHVLFRKIPIPKTRVETGFQDCLSVAESLLAKAKGTLREFEVDEITLKLAFSVKMGLSFIVDSKMETAMEVKIKRQRLPQAAQI